MPETELPRPGASSTDNKGGGRAQSTKRCRLLRWALIVVGCIWLVSFMANSDWDRNQRKKLLGAIKSHDEMAKAINSGGYFSVAQDAVWRRPYTYMGEHLGIKDPIPEHRCQVKTYYDPQNANESAILDVWKRAWWAYGFEPVVLTPADCEKSPQFARFRKSKFNETFKRENYKWFAWAGADAGLMTDIRVIPANWDDDIMGLLRHCEFDYPVQYDPVGLDFVHASVDMAQKKIIRELMRGPRNDPKLAGKKKEQEADNQNAIKDLFDLRYQDLVAYYSRKNTQLMFNKDEMPAAELANVMNAHLHHEFLKRYRRGVGVFDGYKGRFTQPAKDIAGRLLKCPDLKLASNTCPPTTASVELAKTLQKEGVPVFQSPEELCNNPCVDVRSPFARLRTGKTVTDMKSLPGTDSGFYTIASLPHPYTVLAAQERETRVGLEQAETRPVDQTVGKLTSLLPSTLDKDARMLYLKDSMYQVSTMTNISWLLWEDASTRPKNAAGETPSSSSSSSSPPSSAVDMVEWQVGFTLPPSQTKFAEDEYTIAESRARALGTEPDADKQAVEAYSRGDTEVWMFLQSWLAQQERLKDNMLTRTSKAAGKKL